MPDDEYKFKITAEGEQAAQEMRKVADAEDELGRKTEEVGDKANASSAASDKVMGAFGSLGNQVLALAGPAGALVLFNRILAENKRAMEENAEVANRLKESQLDLQFLGSDYNPSELSAVRRAGEISGDLYGSFLAFGELKSKTAAMTDEQRFGLYEQLVETSLTTSAGQSSLVPLFAKMSQFVDDPERLQAIIRESQRLSPAATPQALAGNLPNILSPSEALNLSPEQAAGLLVTALNIDEASGATQLRNTLRILSGGGTDEQTKMLIGYGADPSIGIMAQLAALRGANLGVPEASKLVGGENFTGFLGLLRDTAAKRNIAEIQAASLAGVDTTRQAIENIYGKDEQQRARLGGAQAEARLQQARSTDLQAQLATRARKDLEAGMIASGMPPIMRATRLAAFDTAIGMGMSIQEATLEAENVAFYVNPLLFALDRLTGTDLHQFTSPAASNLIDTDVSAIGRLGAGGGTGAGAGGGGNVTINIDTQINNSDPPGEVIIGRGEE